MKIQSNPPFCWSGTDALWDAFLTGKFRGAPPNTLENGEFRFSDSSWNTSYLLALGCHNLDVESCTGFKPDIFAIFQKNDPVFHDDPVRLKFFSFTLEVARMLLG